MDSTKNTVAALHRWENFYLHSTVKVSSQKFQLSTCTYVLCKHDMP